MNGRRARAGRPGRAAGPGKCPFSLWSRKRVFWTRAAWRRRRGAAAAAFWALNPRTGQSVAGPGRVGADPGYPCDPGDLGGPGDCGDRGGDDGRDGRVDGRRRRWSWTTTTSCDRLRRCRRYRCGSPPCRLVFFPVGQQPETASGRTSGSEPPRRRRRRRWRRRRHLTNATAIGSNGTEFTGRRRRCRQLVFVRPCACVRVYDSAWVCGVGKGVSCSRATHALAADHTRARVSGSARRPRWNNNNNKTYFFKNERRSAVQWPTAVYYEAYIIQSDRETARPVVPLYVGGEKYSKRKWNEKTKNWWKRYR